MNSLPTRESILNNLGSNEAILEIGPFDRPLLRGRNIFYLEAMETNLVKERAMKGADRLPENVPDIDYVGTSGVQSATGGRKFDCIISAHLLEHQPDLIGHISDVLNSLKNEGTYFAIFPNKSTCFDYWIPKSEITEVFAAFLEKRTRPTLRSVIEHRAFTEQNFYMGNRQNPLTDYSEGKLDQILQSYTEWDTNVYVDVHCWYFTLQSSVEIFTYINASKVIDVDFEFEINLRGGELELLLKRLSD